MRQPPQPLWFQLLTVGILTFAWVAVAACLGFLAYLTL